MLLNTDVSIALKNCFNQYDLRKFSLFEIRKTNENFIPLNVKIDNGRGIIIKLKCPLCGGNHCYRYSINEFIRRDLIVGGCEILGVPIFYIGNYEELKQRINKYNNANKYIRAMI